MPVITGAVAGASALAKSKAGEAVTGALDRFGDFVGKLGKDYEKARADDARNRLRQALSGDLDGLAHLLVRAGYYEDIDKRKGPTNTEAAPLQSEKYYAEAVKAYYAGSGITPPIGVALYFGLPLPGVLPESRGFYGIKNPAFREDAQRRGLWESILGADPLELAAGPRSIGSVVSGAVATITGNASLPKYEPAPTTRNAIDAALSDALVTGASGAADDWWARNRATVMPIAVIALAVGLVFLARRKG